MADEDDKQDGVEQTEEEKAAALKKKRAFKKFQYRGAELENLLDLTVDELVRLYPARARRRLSRGLKRKPKALITRLRKAKKEAVPGERPRGIKTHLRNMIIMPEMIGSVVGVYNGKVFHGIEILPDMVGMYLGEFVITYKPVTHGRPGMGATHSSRFIPLK
jgi:small subunit ribosomal protein S15e